MTRPALTVLAVAATAALLGACGGGGSNVAAGTGGTGAPATSGSQQLAAGTITGFGSVIVDGVRYDDSAATVKVERDPASTSSGSLGELKLGMRVEVKADDDGKATEVTVASEVVGRIVSVSATGFVVAGQTVRVSTDAASPTVFEGVGNLEGLVVGDLVEVHGTRDVDDAIVATRIERKDPSAAISIRVVGTVSALKADAKTFSIGGLTVTWTEATRRLPAGVVLADGLRVAVWTDTAIGADGTMSAKSIVVRRPAAADSTTARVGGAVRALDVAAKTFKVDGIDVDASAATFRKGSAADLANGRKVRVRGTFVAGVLKATEVQFVKDRDDAAVALTGVVTDFAGTVFKVRGVPVDVSGPDIRYEHGDAANLADGVLVKIEGAVDADAVKPTKVEFVTNDDARSRWLSDEVSQWDPAAGTFRLMGLDARLAPDASFRRADGSTATPADFGDGERVRVRGTLVSGVFVVSEVVFQSARAPTVTSVEGIAYDVDLEANRFRLNGAVVRIEPTTVFEGRRENLRNGVRVEVTGTLAEGEIVASKVEFEGKPDGDAARMRGPLTDFVSESDFRVAGQRVDASAASIDPEGSTLSAESQGRVVEVVGPVVDGVLKATRLRFK